MTSFNTVENSEYVEDKAMVNCMAPIAFDLSSTQEVLTQYNPIQGTQQYGGVGPSCYNAIQDLRFYIQTDLGSRVRFDKSYLKMEYMAADVSAPAPYLPVVAATTSIPWNPIAGCIQNTYFQMNATNQTVERYDANFQHGNMIKILTQYSRDALETASDRFFTPCIETARDIAAAMSPESQLRTTNHLLNGASINYGSKIMMLSDIFDSMRVETGWFCQTFQLFMTLKAPENILFMTTAATGVNRFYITALKLFICQDKLSEPQQTLQTQRLAENKAPMRNAFWRYDVFTDLHSTTKTYITSSIKNMQCSILMFPSITAGDAIGINPYQYSYCSGLVPNTGISFYRHRYGLIAYPLSGQAVDLANKGRNTEMYEIWRNLIRKINEKEIAPTITFDAMSNANAAADLNPYVFFPAIFCNQDTFPMKTVSGYDHEVYTNGGTAGAIGVIIRMRVNAVMVDATTQIHIMD